MPSLAAAATFSRDRGAEQRVREGGKGWKEKRGESCGVRALVMLEYLNQVWADP